MSTFGHATPAPLYQEDVVETYAAQTRAARVLLGWTRHQLATASCLPPRTIARIELADGRFRKRTLTAVRTALGVAGVIIAVDTKLGGRPGACRQRRERASDLGQPPSEYLLRADAHPAEEPLHGGNVEEQCEHGHRC